MIQKTSPSSWNGARLQPTLLTFAIGLGLWFSPSPEGLTSQTWHLFAIFTTTIIAIILRPLPMGAVALFATAICIVTSTLTLEQSLSSFNSPIVWLVVLAFMIARGFVKTGLGSRVAHLFIRSFGKSTLGLSYSLVLTEFFLAPAVPSNTARGAGIIYPIMKSLAEGYGSSPELGTSRKIGSYLVMVCFNANLITSAMFLTAMACNPVAASLSMGCDVLLDWSTWAKMAFVPGIISLLTLPYIMFRLYPPELKETPQAPELSQKALRDMGPLSNSEKYMLGTFILLLGLWIFGDILKVDATSTALIGISLLLFTGVLEWEDILKEKGAWETLIWFAILLMMAGFLNKFGMMQWFADTIKGVVQGLDWKITLFILLGVYTYIHYLFASVTAHVMAFYGAFLALMIAMGVPPLVGSMGLGIASCLSGCLTHFGTGSAPVYFGAGYVSVQEWWQNGFLMSLVHWIIWGGVGALWWMVLGVI